MNMNKENPATLQELAIQSLLLNESAALQAIEEMPRILFIPLFNAAFLGGHKKILTEMVKIWPFFCLHTGTLQVTDSQSELLKAIVEGLQVLPAHNSASRSPKLKVLDIRQNIDCSTTCPEISTNSLICLYSCTYSEHSILKTKTRRINVHSRSKTQSTRQAMELLADISLDKHMREREFISLLVSKVEQSLGSLHLCCRNLQIDTLSSCKSSLNILDLVCVDYLTIEQGTLSDIGKLLSRMVNLFGVTLSDITYRSLNGKIFKYFLNQLGRMVNLRELNVSSFCLRNHLRKLLRVLPSVLECMCLPFCELSFDDFTVLAQCSQVKQLKILNLTNNSMYWRNLENVQTILENVSGTIEELVMNHCLLTDSTVSSLIPILGRCSQLRCLSFAFNPISMPVLTRIVQHLATHLKELKVVIYPIPVHCYEEWYFLGSLDRQKLVEVQAQVQEIIQTAHREDMKWTTFIQ